MAAYNILFKRSVHKDLAAIPQRDLLRILKRIRELSDDPRPPGAEKLTNREGYRVRQGRYRIVYSIQDSELTVWIITVAHRKQAYK